MSNWNVVLSSTRNLNDVLIVLQKVLALLQNKADVTTIDEALDSLATLDQQAADSIREMTNRLNQFGNDADTATNEAIMRATVRGFATEQILKQWTPNFNGARAKADDTKKVWRWELTSAAGVTPITGNWVDTGLSEKDQAIAAAAQDATEKTKNIKIVHMSDSVFGLADSEDKVFLVVSKTGEYFVPNLSASIQQTLLNLKNDINQLGISNLPSEVALAFNDANEGVFGYFKNDANLMLTGLNESVQESLNYLLARQADMMQALNQHSVELSKYLLPKDLSINATQALASTVNIDPAIQHLPIDTPYRKNDSLVHPNVIELDEPMRGFKYWMCLTPYQGNNILEENPCVYGSNDLEKWELIDGMPQPLDNPPDWDEVGTGAKGYLSDCWWVYDHINNELVCCWRKAYTVGDEKYNNTDILQLLARSTKNGLVWSEPFQIYKDTLYESDALISPSIVFDQNTNKWCMFYMRGANIIVVRTNDDFRNKDGWSDRVDLKFGDFKNANDPNMVAWHFEVKFLGDRLFGLITDTANMAYYLCYADKNDLTKWTYTTHNILPNKPVGKPSVYKASFMLDETTSKIRLFWTSANTNESRLYTALTNQI